MKQIVYKPKDENFRGEIIVKIPSLRTRLRYVKEANFKFNEDGEVSSMSNIDAMETMYTLSEKHIVSVNLVYKEDLKFKTFKDMSDDSCCDDICQDIIKIIMEGALGNA